MAVQEDGFATRASTSYTSSARRSGESAVLVQKRRKPAVFYTVMLTIGTRSRCDPVDLITEDEKMVPQKCAFGIIVVNIL